MPKPEFVGDPFDLKGKIKFKMPHVSFKGRGCIAPILIALLVAAIGFYQSCLEYVRPNEYGIKEIKIGVKRGIRDKAYEPGLTFVLPLGMERMHHFPRDMQVLELTAFETKDSKPERYSSIRAAPTRHYDRAAKIQTSDGFYVDVDVTILYRLIDPYKVMTTVGPGALYLHNGILPKAEPILKEAFGELTTEDFYNSPLRVEKAQKARDLLDAELKPKGIQVDHVLVRYFRYSEEIQKNIEEKKLQDQLVFKNQAEAKAATEEANLKRVTQEGEMRVRVALQEGEAYKVKKDAERELYTRKKRAEADLLVQLAEAKRSELENEAMQVIGSDKLVAMRMAEVLGGLEAILVPAGGPSGLNPLDLDQMLELFGTEALSVSTDADGDAEAAIEVVAPAAPVSAPALSQPAQPNPPPPPPAPPAPVEPSSAVATPADGAQPEEAVQ